MTTRLLFTKAALRNDIPTAALGALLRAQDAATKVVSSHHLIWTLFGDSPSRIRDFLWREHEPGSFFLLSQREPQDTRGLFSLRPAKEFAPQLRTGDQLTFDVRVNATVSRGGGPGVRGKRCDIVMDAIYSSEGKDRARVRAGVLHRVASEWMARQGVTGGFGLDGLEVAGYTALQLPRKRQQPAATVGVLDLRGQLSVREPAAFHTTLASGIGRSKAFGCGLMLIRRA